MEPQRDMFFAHNHAQTLDFTLSAVLNPTTNQVEVSLRAQAFVRIQKFSGFLIVFNQSEYNLANLHGWRYGYNPYQYTSTLGFLLDLRIVQPLYGPSHRGKCLFGISKLTYRGDDAFNYEFGRTPVYNSIVSFTETIGSSSVGYSGTVFCIGKYIACYEYLDTHVDQYTLQCYMPASCPLPTIPVWNSRTLCMRCADYACHTCDVPTRKICSGCRGHLFTFLNTTTKKCQCIINYMPVKYPTKPGEGLWGDQDETLWLCKVNCSAAIKNCIFGACTNQTYCNSCEYMYTLNEISMEVRRCTRCATILSNCIACSATNACDLCAKNHYLVDYFDSNGVLIVTQCRPCRDAVQHCIQCTQTGVCIQCSRPYDLGITGKCDQCLSTYQNYSNVCMLYHGCMTTKIIEDGSEICLACIPGIHYYYDVSTLSCICERGYYETSDPQYWYICEPQCGDGIVIFLTEECDDKNTNNGDGCSDFCKVQDGYSCLPYEPSKCVFIINFQLFQYKYVYRIMEQNRAIFYFKILPHDIRLETLDWKSLIRFNFTQQAVRHLDLNFTYSYETDEIEVLVPYSKQLENLITQTRLSLVPEHVVSNLSEFLQSYQVNGINAPLIFESTLILKTKKIVDLLSLVFSLVILLQFYIGSYFGKMIGLETLQVIQTIYFARMAIVSEDSSFVNSLNKLKYTTVGYSNPKLFYSDLKFAKNDVYTSQRGVLQSIGMHKYFLLNIDFFLATILAVVVVYCRYFHRKAKIRSDYIKKRAQQTKDQYTSFKRKAEWVYSHVFFPTVMMFNYVLFFTTISSEQPSTAKELVPLKTVETISFPFYNTVFYLTIAVWSFEIFNSYEAFIKSRMTEQQKNMTPPSLIEKLQHDENSPDRPNFHTFYILVYLMFYLILQLAMVLSIFLKEFQFTLESILGLSLVYFGLIWKWGPYNKTIDVHNKFLRLNHGTVVFFLLSFTIMKWAKHLHQKIQVTLMYANVGLIGLVVLGGFARIYYEHRYRVLGLEDTAIAQMKASEIKKLNGGSEMTKKGRLLMNNKYLFQRQLQEIGQKYGLEYKLLEQELGRPQKRSKNQRQKQILINKIRNDLKDPQKVRREENKGNGLNTRLREHERLTEEEPTLDEIKKRLRNEFKHSSGWSKLPWM